MKRRALLSALSSASVFGTAGCLSDSNGSTPSSGATSTATGIPSTTGTEASTPAATEASTPPEPDDRVGIGVLNETETAHTLSIRLADAERGTEILAETLDVRDGIHRGVDGSEVGEGTYSVVADVDAGATLEYEWRVTPQLRQLTLVLTEDGGLEPRQRATADVDDDLPYTVDGASSIHAPPHAEVRNDGDADAVLTLALEREGERFFEHAFEATTDREIHTPPLVASAGTYDVVAEADDGRRATYEWEIPENYHWPLLAVLVDEDGVLRVGCSFSREAPVSVENRDGTDRELTLRLSSGGDIVAEATESVPPGGRIIALDTPIGGEYELHAETAEGTATADYSTCYCYSTDTRVRIDEGVPSIDSPRLVCE
ncbi:hypothetical protein [Halogeometricum luteum]|uniref:Ig-like domain-containing protein n=1 Tax=Halogeometricum luteum TaxID=2950537 RepID=A0ABU2G3E7_9EURY|nr:hypothetical protein [Halogeometricum sp. S3BR5-2]MDS0294759.1 hypothetical protein [Halogeometricum sp. S3BR5-2]